MVLNVGAALSEVGGHKTNKPRRQRSGGCGEEGKVQLRETTYLNLVLGTARGYHHGQGPHAQAGGGGSASATGERV